MKTVRIVSYNCVNLKHDRSAVFLSDNFSLFFDLKQRLPELRGLGSLFHKELKHLQPELLRASDEFNRANSSDLFWTTSIASRNCADTPFIKNILYLHCANIIVSQSNDDVTFIVESHALACALESLFNNQKCLVQVQLDIKMQFRRILFPLKLIARALYFVTRWSYYWTYIRSLNNVRMSPQSKQPRALIRSWYTKGVMQAHGVYRDRNFGELLEFLKSNGRDVWIVPLFFNMGAALKDNLKAMQNCSVQFLFAEQYLSFFTSLKMVWREFRSLALKECSFTFEGHDVSKIVQEAHLHRAFAPQAMEYNMVYELLKTLSSRGYDVSSIIYTFENNRVEKTLLVAARRFYPNVQIKAFQHSVWYKEQMSMYLRESEISYHPLPDQIICSGKKYLSVLEDAGFPVSRLIHGPNLRFTDVFLNHKIAKPEQFCISIILNFDTNQSYELLYKMNLALKDIKSAQVKIKAHPILNKKCLIDFLSAINFPDYSFVEKGTVQELVCQSSLVVMGGASVSNLEVLSLGVPLLRVSLESNFDFDAVWENDLGLEMISSPQELTERMLQIQEYKTEDYAKLEKLGQRILSEYFEPSESSKMKVFL